MKRDQDIEDRAELERIAVEAGDIEELIASDKRGAFTTGEHVRTRASRVSEDDAKHVRELKRLLDSGEQLEKVKASESFLHCKRTLTPQQQKYLDGLLRGETMVKAYRAAYNIGAHRTDKSVHADAWRLADHPVIVLELKLAVMRKREHRIRNAAYIREHVIEGLIKESTQAETASARVRAYELLGKLAEVGMFVDRKEIKHTSDDPETMKRMLVAKLREFFITNKEAAEELPVLEHTEETQKKE